MKNSNLTYRLVLIVLLVVSSLGLTVPGQNPKGADDGRQALLDLEEHWLHSENNPDAIEKIVADDFVHVLPFGFINKDEQIRHAKQLASAPSTLEKHFEDLQVRIYGVAGIVNGMVVTVASDGSVKKILFTDVFVQRNGAWQAVNAQESPFQPSPKR